MYHYRRDSVNESDTCPLCCCLRSIAITSLLAARCSTSRMATPRTPRSFAVVAVTVVLALAVVTVSGTDEGESDWHWVEDAQELGGASTSDMQRELPPNVLAALEMEYAALSNRGKPPPTFQQTAPLHRYPHGFGAASGVPPGIDRPPPGFGAASGVPPGIDRPPAGFGAASGIDTPSIPTRDRLSEQAQEMAELLRSEPGEELPLQQLLANIGEHAPYAVAISSGSSSGDGGSQQGSGMHGHDPEMRRRLEPLNRFAYDPEHIEPLSTSSKKFTNEHAVSYLTNTLLTSPVVQLNRINDDLVLTTKNAIRVRSGAAQARDEMVLTHACLCVRVLACLLASAAEAHADTLRTWGHSRIRSDPHT